MDQFVMDNDLSREEAEIELELTLRIKRQFSPAPGAREWPHGPVHDTFDPGEGCARSEDQVRPVKEILEEVLVGVMELGDGGLLRADRGEATPQPTKQAGPASQQKCIVGRLLDIDSLLDNSSEGGEDPEVCRVQMEDQPRYDSAEREPGEGAGRGSQAGPLQERRAGRDQN